MRKAHSRMIYNHGMRPLVLVLCVLFLSGTANIAWAYYDDSVVIEIGGGLPPEPPASTPPQGSSQVDTGAGAGGGSSDTGSVGSGGGVGGATGESTGGGNTTSDGGSFGSSGGGPSVGENGSVSNNPNTPGEELFNVLVAQGAITGGGANLNGGTAGSLGTTLSNPSAGNGGSDGSGDISSGNTANTTVNAIQLRKTLRNNQNFEQILDDFSSSVRAGTYGKRLTARGVGLMAASTMLGNTDIQELSFGATKFEMVYRSRGYLFGFIPKTFPVRISVNPQATAAGERVTLALPWYRFFLRKLFTSSSLAREIDTVVAADVRGDEDSAADVQARLFETVSLLLKQKIGTVGGSIQGV